MTPLDQTRMQEALALAEGAVGSTEPNPRVGCVIGSEVGEVFGRGATSFAGGPHAEVVALRDAERAGKMLAGATAWVTLEPCAHHGRTPPCCNALIAAGLKRVVVAVQDPYPQVAGAGVARMRAAGVQVEMADSAAAQAAWELNIGFFSRMLRQRPWVRVKLAASLDGRTALADGSSQWITGEAARADGHVWRRRASAVLTGIGTVLADDPRLDTRLAGGDWHPLRVVVDSRLRTPSHARLLAPPGRVLIATARPMARQADPTWAETEFVSICNIDQSDVDLPGLMRELAQRGVNEVHVEAGPTLSAALLLAGLVDEWLVYLAPKFLGPGRDLLALTALGSLSKAHELDLVEHRMVGPDLRLRLRPRSAPFTTASWPGAPSEPRSKA